MSVRDAVAKELAAGRTVDQAAQRLGIPLRDAMASFKEIARQATVRQRRMQTPLSAQAPRATVIPSAPMSAAAPLAVLRPSEPVPANSGSVASDPAGMQRLWCDAGAHSWERPAQRGRKPRCCPQHR